jgi:hypothetical protein
MYLPFTREYFLQLTPMAQKLALYLSKIFSPYSKRPRRAWKKPLRELAKQLPITQEETWQIRRQLDRVMAKLVETDFPFLDPTRPYEYTGRDREWVVFYNRDSGQLALPMGVAVKDEVVIDDLVSEQLRCCGDPGSEAWYRQIAQRVPTEGVYLCLAEARDAVREYTRKGQACNIGKLYSSIVIGKFGHYLGKTR